MEATVRHVKTTLIWFKFYFYFFLYSPTDGSRAALALSWSYNGSRNLDARRQEAIRNVIERSNSSKPTSRAEVISNIHGCPSTEACQRKDHKNFVVTNRGFPIDPDYNIMTRPSADGYQGGGGGDDFSKRRGVFSSRSDNCNTPLYLGGRTSSASSTSRAKTSIGNIVNYIFFIIIVLKQHQKLDWPEGFWDLKEGISSQKLAIFINTKECG